MHTTLVTKLAYPECPRWHAGCLWFSDQHSGYVYQVSESGDVLDSFSVPGGPAGLGWLPDGELVVVSMSQKRLFRRREKGPLQLVSELGDLHPGDSNDLVAAADGTVYVGNIGFNFDAGDPMVTTNLAMVRPDGTSSIVADNLMVPNGMIISEDGTQLIVAESWSHRLTAFTISPDGQLSDRRVWAELGAHVPDGICLDREGHVWFASPFEKGVYRVKEGGDIIDEIPIEGGNAYACMLGGSHNRRLYVCVAPGHDKQLTLEKRSGRIDVYDVECGRAGRP